MTELDRMRAFLAAVMHGRPLDAEPPPVALVQINHLGPIAYRMGMTELRAEYAASLIMADRRARLLREAVAAFAARGIEVALLKGIGFAGTIYPDPAERPMQDIDLLVRVADLPGAIEVVKQLGFERHGYERKLSDYYHAIAWRRADLMIELHRNIQQGHRMRMNLDEVWSRMTADPLGSGARRMAPVDDALMCILHVSRGELALPALNYLDVWRLWQRLDAGARAELHDRARAWRVERAVTAVLDMTELLAAGRSARPDLGPGSALLPLTDDVLRGARPPRLRQIAQKLLLTEGPREALGLGFAHVGAIAQGWWRSRGE